MQVYASVLWSSLHFTFMSVSYNKGDVVNFEGA